MQHLDIMAMTACNQFHRLIKNIKLPRFCKHNAAGWLYQVIEFELVSAPF